MMEGLTSTPDRTGVRESARSRIGRLSWDTCARNYLALYHSVENGALSAFEPEMPLSR